jgi:glucosylceramidase
MTLPGGIVLGAWYNIVNHQSPWLCVDVQNAGTTDGTPIQVWSCGNQYNQQWQFIPTDSGYFQVVSRNSPGMVLDLQGGSMQFSNGALIHLWTWLGHDNQQWMPQVLPGGDLQFVVRNSGKCLDASWQQGTQLDQWDCDPTSKDERFILVQQP